MDCYLLDIHWLREAFEGIGARDQALGWGIRTNLINKVIISNLTFMVHVTDYGRPMKPFFIEILNFWAWADKFWSICGIWCFFGQFINTHFGTVSPLSMFFINQPLFLQKSKPLYQNPKYLFGI